MIDLHIHSNCSDGTFSPSEIAAFAVSSDLYGFSLTDHDTTEGVKKILAANLPENIRFLPGIEISCDTKKHEIHILGYGIHPDHDNLNKKLRSLRQGRLQRNLDMISLLQKDGLPVTMEKLQGGRHDTVITRAHFAKVLVEEGICRTKEQAFKKYLGENCKYYLPKPFFAPEDALRLIIQAGGIPFLAHPFQYGFSNLELKHLIEHLTTSGLKGLEVYHSTHHIGQITKLRQWQKQYCLLASGGSDFHGSNKPDISIGTGRGPLYVPDHLLDQIFDALETA